MTGDPTLGLLTAGSVVVDLVFDTAIIFPSLFISIARISALDIVMSFARLVAGGGNKKPLLFVGID